ncbi:hypothetical protein [Pedobacter nutrimenti]|uniref:hypothetical protein n=1 Tax=Pedobacter nutrimenti TaxID=1241337 RepID=UPI002931F648|nr:hypothetical protein [Pedobacter nutrimenti]
MKTTTKIIASAVAAVALFFTTNVNAQSPKLGIGLNAGIPTTNGYNFALGGDLRFQFDVSKQVSIPVTAGYTNFFGKKDYFAPGVDMPSAGYIPVKAGVKVFFDETGSGFYGMGELGAAIGVSNNAKTGFLYSPAIGYSWSNGLDLGLKYEGIAKGTKIGPENMNQVALRIAYGFKI